MSTPLLIFHLNGALIDTRHSVDSAVRRAVQFYLSSFLGSTGSGILVEEEDLLSFRLAGGLDNPWELAAAMLRYILSELPPVRHRGSPPRNPGEAVAVLKRRSGEVRVPTWEELRERLDFAATGAKIREAGGGVAGVGKVLGGWEHPLLLADGEVGEGNLLRFLFEEIYLGRTHFARLAHTSARFYRGSGLMDNERVLVGFHALEQLRSHYRGRMGLVTEWDRAMAQLAMDSLKLSPLFDVLITHEDVVSEEARLHRRDEWRSLAKPDPFMMLEAARHLDPTGSAPAVVIGSTPDDMRAASAAGQQGERTFHPWAILTMEGNTRLHEALEQAGAARLFARPEPLVEALRAEVGA